MKQRKNESEPAEILITEMGQATTVEKKVKRPYEKMKIVPIEFETNTPILAASVVKNSAITLVGQETGPEYDISFDTDPNTGKEFSHEWE